MAETLNVKFRGDEGNSKAFFAGLQQGPEKVVEAISAANAQLLRSTYGISNLPNRAGIFPDVKALRSQVDAVSGVVRQVGQLGYTINRATSTPGKFLPEFIPIQQVEALQGNVDKIITAMGKYSNAVRSLDRLEASRDRFLPQLNQQIKDRALSLATPRLGYARENLVGTRQALADVNAERLRQGVIAGSTSGVVQQQAMQRIVQLEQEALALEQATAVAVKERNAARAAENRLLQNDVELQRLSAKAGRYPTLIGRQAALRDAAEAERNAAISGPIGTVPENYPALARNKQLLAALEKAGLPKGTDFANLQKQTFNAPRYDLVRDVTRYSGSFERSGGIIADWTAEVDKGGKLVTRFGGQLSGASQALKQIARDFQKVIEFTIATTVVFATLQFTIEQLRSLTDLDFALQKFAITAQQSPKEAQQSFGRLAQIAHDTATPLLEIVGAADDIALATQRAGQSTDAWRQQIFSLTESVGIFTNLTGIDTVQATDLLTATMKQLRLTASDIPAILSKITAVAGGQSQAISDITKGLSVMAEAGRVAGLSLDQQIATVQVLSQVTSKTPAEVATSFKNLVGSLGSPGALKGLAQFNIAVRTQSGELRNILDIYREISDKIKSGIIPAADVQGLIRQISGGPRRAPDAAALLAAIDQISAAEKKSSQATNEAAIANAKAIDTTKAKFIQLQNTINTVTFEKFGGEFKNLIGSLVTLLTTVLGAFNKIPTGAIAAALQIGLFFLAIRTGTRLLGFLASFLAETKAGFLSLAQSIRATTVAQAELNATSIKGPNPLGLGAGGPAARASKLNLANIGRVGASAAIGAGISAATGGNAAQIAGGGLQGLGIALLAFPEPTLITKLAGGIALLGGTLLQFASASTEAADKGEKAAQVLDAYSQFKSASEDLNTLGQSQSSLAAGIEKLTNTAHKGAEDYSHLDSAQRDYAEGVIASIDATNQAAVARETLIASLPDELANELKLSDQYGVTSDKLQQLVLDMQKVLFLRANPNLQFPEVTALERPPTARQTPYDNSGTGVFLPPRTTTPTGQRGTDTRSIVTSQLNDLKQLAAAPQLVKELFSNGELSGAFAPTKENLKLIGDAIDALKKSSDPAADSLFKMFSTFAEGNDIVKQTSNAIASYSDYIDKLSLFQPEKSAELKKVADLVNRIPTSNQGLREKGAGLLYESIQPGATVDYAKVRALGEDLYNTLDEGTKKNITSTQYLTALFTHLGIALDLVGIKAAAALQGVSADAVATADALDSSLASLSSGISDRLSKVQADFQSGVIKKDVFTQSMAGLRAYGSLINTVGESFGKALRETPQFAESLKFVQGEFSNVVGLENAASLSSEDFISKLLTLADTYGLNGKQLIELAVKLANFKKLVDELAKLKINLPIGVTLDLTSIRKAIAGLKAILPTSKLFGGKNLGGGEKVPGSADVSGQLSALQSLEQLLAALESSSTGIQKTLAKGKGSPIGSYPSAGKTKPGLDISTLDLPEGITKSANASELIQQAIANAKKLQSQIPGAAKDAKNDLVILLDGLTKVMQVQGVKSEYLSKALAELAAVEQKRLDFETKADTIRRIRVGAGDFSAIANVPVNSTTGVSLGGANAVNVTLNLNGTVLTPAQLAQFADLVAAALKRQIAGG